MAEKHAKKRFTEKDISINDMFSRSGKATENMHLTLANVIKMKKKESGKS